MRPRIKSEVRTLATLLAVACLAASFSASASASAAQVHPFSSFAPAPLGEAFGLAVDPASGDIYAGEFEAGGSLAKFDPAGSLVSGFGSGGTLDGSTTPEGAFGRVVGLATDPTGGDLYVGEETAERQGVVLKFDSAGALVTGFGDSSPAPNGQLSGLETGAGSINPDAVAVSPTSGDLYVADLVHSVVDVFSSDGVFESEFPTTEEPRGVAVDPAGDVYVAGSSGVTVYEPSGAPDPAIGAGTGLLDPEASRAVAVEPTGGDVYVAEEDEIARYSPSGSLLERFGSAQIGPPGPLAVRADGTIDVADPAHREVDVFGALVTVPDVTTGAPGEVSGFSATLNGTVNSAGTEAEDALAGCRFEYVTLAAFEASGFTDLASGGTADCVPAATAIPDDGADHAVNARLEGVLAAATEYRFRLRAENQNGTPEFGAVETLTTPPPPTISGLATTAITATGAVLGGEVDPNGSDTHYRFEWGTTTGYGNEVPLGGLGEDLGSGSEALAVSAPLAGLSAGTTYHWRLSAENANGPSHSADQTFVFLGGLGPSSGCPNEALRTGLSAALPDCRAYELITPPQKNGALVGAVTEGQPPEVAEDGSALVLTAAQCFPTTTSCVGVRGPTGTVYRFLHGPGGWESTNLAPSAAEYEVNTWVHFNAESGTALFSAPVAPSGEDHLLARGAGGAFTDLGPVAPTTDFQQVIRPTLAASSTGTTDLTHFVYGNAAEPIWPFASGQGPSYYEYSGVGSSAPQLVGVRGGPGSTSLISECGTIFGVSVNEVPFGALSADGRTAFFTAVHDESCTLAQPPASELFARIDNGETGARSVAISQPDASETGAPNPGCTSTECIENTTVPANFRGAQFVGASGAGDAVYFTDTQQLTDSASQDPNPTDRALGSECADTRGPGGCNLYLYVDPQQSPLVGSHLIDVSAGDVSGGGPRVQGVLAYSADGSHVYFVAKGVLTGADAEGQSPQAGAENLYAFSRGSSTTNGHLAFVAALPEADVGEWELLGQPANASRNGRYLLFTSSAALTPDVTRAEGPEQIYRYDAATETLIRISIGERGYNDNGNSGFGAATVVPGFTGYQRLGPGRSDPSMSHDGTHVFFLSPQALAPGALDDVPNTAGSGLASNLYEWEEDGTGACTVAAGCVYLLSDGRDVGARHPEVNQCSSSTCLVGVDGSGENVFFSSSEQLVPRDTDTQLDFYDARVNGGLAEAPAVVPCEGDACKGAAPSPPGLASPGSSTFNGPSDPTPGPHRKKHHHKKKHHKKHHKKKNHHPKHQKQKHQRSAKKSGGRDQGGKR